MKDKITVQCSYCGAKTEIEENAQGRPLCDKCREIFEEDNENKETEEVLKFSPHVQILLLENN